MGFLDGTTLEPAKTVEISKDDGKTKETIANPEYDSWLAKDQQVLSYLLNSLTKDTLGPVAIATTVVQAWAALEGMFAAHSKARTVNLRMQLTTLKNGGMTTAAYYNKMSAIKDELAAIGKVIEDEEMISYLMNGLDYDYNPVVSSILGQASTLSLADVYSELLAYDLCQEMYGQTGQSFVNAAARGRGGMNRGRDDNRGRGPNNNRGQNRGFPSTGSSTPRQGGRPKNGGNSNRPQCQICKKQGHEASKCWFHYKEDDEQKIAGTTVLAMDSTPIGWPTAVLQIM